MGKKNRKKNIYKSKVKANAKKDRVLAPPYLNVGNYDYPIPYPTNKQKLLDAFKSWPYVFANKNATSMANVKLNVYVSKNNTKELSSYESIKKDKEIFDHLRNMDSVDDQVRKAMEIEELFDHPLKTLLRKGNPFMTGFELRYLTAIYLEMTGDAYWYIPVNGLNVPNQIWPLNPANVEIVPKSNGFLAGYVYTIGGEQIPFDPDEIVHFKYPNPNDMYYGISPLEANWASYVIDEGISTYQNSTFRNMGRPDGLLMFDQNLDEEAYERVREAWQASYGGASKAGKIAILEGGSKFTPVSITPRDLEYLDGKKSTKEQLANSFGQTLGMYSESANRANAEASLYDYILSTIMPKMNFIVEKINQQLAPMFDDKIFVAYENIVPENKDFELKKIDLFLKNGIKSVNEIRKEEGLDGAIWGEYPITNMAQIPFSYDTTSNKMVMDEIAFSNRAAGTPTEEPASEEEKPKDDKDKNKEKSFQIINKQEAFDDDDIQVTWEEFVEDAEAYEKPYAKKIEAFYKIYIKDIKQRAKKSDDYVDWIPKDSDYRESLELLSAKYMSKMFNKSKKKSIRELKRLVRQQKQVDVEDMFNVKDEDAISAIENMIGKAATSILDASKKQTMLVILEGIENGYSNTQIVNNIVDKLEDFSEFEAGQVARTQIIWAGNAGRVQSFKDSGFVKTKIWWTALDERVCVYCSSLHGNEVPVDESFDLAKLEELGLNTKFHEGTLEHPPVHPYGRCLVIAGEITF